ncbi:diguanylate cyclase [Neptunicella sp. SCSIO 80796]|uniref:GGDEF domain-containing protein n=1 Tax=Neptunicella plasticusilytica TaxID=3117012 RepID=UPI003A4E0791
MYKLFIQAVFLFLCFFPFTVIANGINDVLKQADHLRTSAPDESAQLLASIPVEQLNEKQQAIYSFLKAFSTLMKGETQNGISQMEALANNTPFSDIRTRALSSLLNSYSGLHEWNKAFTTIELLRHAMVKIDDINIKDYAAIATISFYTNIQEYSSARSHAQLLIETTSNDRTICSAMNKKLYADIKLSNSNITEYNFKEAISFCQSLGETVLAQAIVTNLAQYYIDQKQPQRAQKILLENIDTVKSLNFQSLTSFFISLLIEAYEGSGNLESAAPYAEDIINNYSSDDFYYSHLVAFKVLSQLSERNKNYQESLVFFKKFKALEKRDFDDKMAQKLAIQKAKIDRDNQLKLLNKENKLLMTQTELVAERTRNTQLLLTCTVLLLGIAIIWLIKSRITHKMLRKIAQTDELTGICNRHYFTSQAETSLNYCQKTRQEVSFIVFDLDHFKQVNDNYGHQVGDWALKQAVLAVQKMCRANDIIGRLGGEEFAILLPGCGTDKANQLAESCRQAIANISTSETGHQFKITASFGISHNAQAGYDLDKLFACADQALYRSKESGRNKVYAYQDEVAVPS